MNDLVEFLKARLAEDRLLALTAMAADGDVRSQEWSALGPGHLEGRVEDGRGEVVVYDEGSPTRAQAMHIARHDPARVLREVEAGRKLLRLLEQARPSFPQAVVRLIEDIVRDRAAVYSDHPDYQESWKP